MEKVRIIKREFGANKNHPGNFENYDGWRITLGRGYRRLSVDFFTGSAWREREITALDVFSCLVSDCQSIENSRDFSDFCLELGYSDDSINALEIYRACKAMAKKMRRFLGDDYTAILEMDEDELAEICE